MDNIIISTYRFLVFCLFAGILCCIRRMSLSTSVKLILFGTSLVLLHRKGLLILNEQEFHGYGVDLFRDELQAWDAWYQTYYEQFMYFILAVFTSRMLDQIKL